jgi:hypothetical protein
MRSALVLMGGQNYKAVGAELLTISGLSAVVYVNGYIQAHKKGRGPNRLRPIVGTSLYLVEIIGAAILIFGSISGLYIAAIAMVANTCYMITGAWLLVISAFKE